MKEQKDSDVSLNGIYKLVKENNRMLKRMRRDAFVGGLLKFVWWIAILFVIPYLIYVFYLEPYVLQLQSIYGTVNESAETINDAAGEIRSFQDRIPDFSSFFGGGG